MGLKGSGPFFQRSIENNVLVGYIRNNCEVYIDDVLIHGDSDQAYLSNTRKVLERLRSKKVTAKPRKTELGLDKVEYVGHLISSERKYSTSLYPLHKCTPTIYFRDQVPNMTETMHLLQALFICRHVRDPIKYNGQSIV